MNPAKLFLFLGCTLLSVPALAQEPVPPPAPPVVPAPEPAPQPEAPEAEPTPAPEEPPPPSPRPVPRRKAPPVVVEEPAAPKAGFGLELATSGFASGTLQGGLLLGAHIGNGALLGVRLDYADETSKVGSMSTSTTAAAVGLAARFPVAGSKEGLDVALALDLAYVKAERAARADPDVSATNATGFRVGIGPQLRYWIHPNVAVGYLAQASYLSLSLEQKGPDGEALEESKTNFAGTFTVTAGF